MARIRNNYRRRRMQQRQEAQSAADYVEESSCTARPGWKQRGRGVTSDVERRERREGLDAAPTGEGTRKDVARCPQLDWTLAGCLHRASLVIGPPFLCSTFLRTANHQQPTTEHQHHHRGPNARANAWLPVATCAQFTVDYVLGVQQPAPTDSGVDKNKPNQSHTDSSRMSCAQTT
ncbi:hypothetical protein T440DRAFT_158842 [Plenodomus tracheiphilus IPT5]|uniref:Uncharacterized protein n=1 Tax=Plenodomus tracheiphilus IPT5 TaxID=1408161 RepID=A0A6A7BKB6_9PLEO|nr:hypothetical protein T440DRAFT_158842 [Plenodomus tracheiphilus IPT5]